VDLGGVLFVVDSGNNTVRRLSQTVVAGITNWIVSTIAGSADFYGVSDGTGANALFDYPNEIALDRAGTLYVTDTYNNTVRRGWSPPVIVLGVPSYTASQVQIGFALAAGSAASFSLLNAPSLSGPWVTNTLATLVTNLPGVSFTFTVPLSQNPAQFCRVQSP